MEYSKYILHKLLPFLKRLNEEQMTEKEVEAKIQGTIYLFMYCLKEIALYKKFFNPCYKCAFAYNIHSVCIVWFSNELLKANDKRICKHCVRRSCILHAFFHSQVNSVHSVISTLCFSLWVQHWLWISRQGNIFVLCISWAVHNWRAVVEFNLKLIHYASLLNIF